MPRIDPTKVTWDEDAIDASRVTWDTPPARPQVTAPPQVTTPPVDEQPQPHPADDLPWYQKFAIGAGAATEKAYRGVRSLLPPGLLPDDLMGGKGRGAEAAQVYEKYHPGGWATAGEIGADVAMSAIPVARGGQAVGAVARQVLPRAVARAAPVVGDVAANALYAGLTAPEDRGAAAAFGGGGALAGAGLLGVLNRVVRPVSFGPEAQRLSDLGVDVTLGQVMAEKAADTGRKALPRAVARAVSRGEEAAMSVPLAGAPLRGMRERGVEAFQRGTREAALPPGAPKEAAASLDKLGSAISSAYDDILLDAKWAGTSPFDQLGPRGLDDAVGGLARERALPPEAVTKARGAVASILDTVPTKIEGTPEGAHNVEKRLKALAFKYKGSPDPDTREYGQLLHDTASHWREGWRQALPEDKVAQLAQVDAAHAAFVPIRRAGATGNLADPEAYTPKQLLRPIRAGDKSPNKERYLRGGLPQQDLAKAADVVLGAKVPDSGTAERAPWTLGGLGALLTAGPAVALYGQPIVQRWLTGQSGPAVQAAVTQGIEQISGLPPAAQEAAMRQLVQQISRATGEQIPYTPPQE